MKWPQILIFPEGVCTNRSCLITFKLGAFSPGVPVQPVLLWYPKTWQGFTRVQALMLTLSQPFTWVEVEFMPVYSPSEEEKKDPHPFCQLSPNQHGKCFETPCDGSHFRRLQTDGFCWCPSTTHGSWFGGIYNIRKLKLDWDNIHKHLDKYAEIAVASKGGKIGIEEFSSYLKFPISEPPESAFFLSLT